MANNFSGKIIRREYFRDGRDYKKPPNTPSNPMGVEYSGVDAAGPT